MGIRAGEKLHEAMISMDEARQTVELEDRYVIQPSHPWWNQRILARKVRDFPMGSNIRVIRTTIG